MEVDVSKLMKEVEDYENRYENKYIGSMAARRIAAALGESSMEAVLISLKQSVSDKYAKTAKPITSSAIIEAKNKAIEQRNQHLSRFTTAYKRK